MQKLSQYIAAAFLTVILLLGQSSAAFAEDSGPAFDASLTGHETSFNVFVTTDKDQPSAEDTIPAVEDTVPTIKVVEELPEITDPNAPNIQIQIMSMDRQWSNPILSGGTITAGEGGFRSICIYMNNIVGNVLYRTYSASNGWSQWAMNGQQTPIWEDNSPVEAMQIRFTGYARNLFHIYYKTTLSDGSTMDWAGDGDTAGTMAAGNYITGIRTTFWGRTDAQAWPYSTANPVKSAAYDGVMEGTPAVYSSGTGAVYSGWGWKDNSRYYFVDNTAVTGWQYIDGYKYYFDEMTGKLLTDLEPLVGTDGPFYIKINKAMNTLSIFAKDGDNGYIIPVKSFLCSTGDDTPTGEHKTPEKYRWRLMNTDEYCQYCTRIGAGIPILMHSVIYEKADSYTLKASTYNYLGANKSHGCVRLTTKDAKWIYDYCPIGTTVYVYEDSVPGPYDRPAIEWTIPSDQDWDPTDPNVTENPTAQAD